MSMETLLIIVLVVVLLGGRSSRVSSLSGCTGARVEEKSKPGKWKTFVPEIALPAVRAYAPASFLFGGLIVQNSFASACFTNPL